MGCPQAVFTCYAKRRKGRWYAHCIDLEIGAVGGSQDAIETALTERVNDYVLAIMTSHDRRRVNWLFGHSNSWQNSFQYGAAKVKNSLCRLLFLQRYHFFQVATPLTADYLVHGRAPVEYTFLQAFPMASLLRVPYTSALNIVLSQRVPVNTTNDAPTQNNIDVMQPSAAIFQIA